ncbi:CLUMA_CG009324, isoform B [Clunio marinus]|uniref:Phenoloxidase-activating factor 2 n=1 Tax=Clunio marinus TaxID=568069 RepID=A0A1J1IA94_9DIPT|nr:CLUMA_CG009324, isoform B [Clunio marinus]
MLNETSKILFLHTIKQALRSEVMSYNMKFKLLLFLNSILLLNTINCEEEIKERVLNRNDFEAFPVIEKQNIQEYSPTNITAVDTTFEDVIDEIIDSSRQGRNIDGLDEVYADPTVKQALLNGDDTQARNLIRDKLCSLGLMECEKRAPVRYIYTQPPPGAVYNSRPVQRPPPSVNGIYGPPRPVPIPGSHPQQPPRKVGYAPSHLNQFQSSKPIGPIRDKYSTDFFDVEQSPSSIKFGYTDKPTIVVNQGKREAAAGSQNTHIHHHYVHTDGNVPAVVDGTKTVLVNTPISEYAAVNHLSGSYQTSGFGSSSAGSNGFSPSNNGFEYKGVNSGNQGIYGHSTNVKPVIETNPNQYASGGNYNQYHQQQQQQQQQHQQQQHGLINEGTNGIYSNGGVGSSFHSSAPDYYKKELNINGNRGNGLTSSNFYNSQQQQQQYSNKYNKYNQGEQYQGFESARQDQYECVCTPFDQCAAQDVVGRRDDLILPLDPRNLPTEIEADSDNSTVTTRDVSEADKKESSEEVKKISKRQVNNDVERVQGEGSIPTQAPGAAKGSAMVSFPTSRRRRDTDQVVPASIDKKVSLETVDGGETNDQEGRAYTAGKRQAFYQQPKQCGPRAVCCRKSYRVPQQALHNPQFQQQQQQHKYNRCGVRNSQGINGRIKNPVYIDGDSEFGEYPWQAAILKKDPKESVYVCGGTLIDANHIITAAHCVKTYSGFDLRVRLGEWDVNHDVEFYPYVERDVISVHVHPEYYAGTLDNDLAILKLSQPVDFSGTPHISPACLPDKFTDFSRQRCWTTGWGKDNWEYGKYQNILKEVDVPIIDQNTCQNQLRQTRLGYNYVLNPGFICAGGEEGKDACKGDGGGPLVCERNGVWQVAGIVSWGIGCGKANVPGVYVRVAHYLDWIAQITQRY